MLSLDIIKVVDTSKIIRFIIVVEVLHVSSKAIVADCLQDQPEA
jgi:hypothetical protein